jgi:hypothetical protein
MAGSMAKVEAIFSLEAHNLYGKFYNHWERRKRKGLYDVAVKRIPVYVRKIAMIYGYLENTLPQITEDQTKASIAVGLYGAACARRLVDAQMAYARPEHELEQLFLNWLEKNDGALKRYMQQTLSKYTGGCRLFTETLRNLQQADCVEVKGKPGERQRVFLVR